jgi:hypothetical protein
LDQVADLPLKRFFSGGLRFLDVPLEKATGSPTVSGRFAVISTVLMSYRSTG